MSPVLQEDGLSGFSMGKKWSLGSLTEMTVSGGMLLVFGVRSNNWSDLRCSRREEAGSSGLEPLVKKEER